MARTWWENQEKLQLAAKHSFRPSATFRARVPTIPTARCVGRIIALANVTGNHAHIHHLNSSSQRAIGITADMIRKAEARGIPISMGSYTYGESSTTIGATLSTPAAMKAQREPSDIQFNGKHLDDASFKELRWKNRARRSYCISWICLDHAARNF
jgi:hypothetical protein